MQNLGRFQFNFPNMIYWSSVCGALVLSGTSGGRQALTTLTIVFGRSTVQQSRILVSLSLGVGMVRARNCRRPEMPRLAMWVACCCSVSLISESVKVRCRIKRDC